MWGEKWGRVKESESRKVSGIEMYAECVSEGGV